MFIPCGEPKVKLEKTNFMYMYKSKIFSYVDDKGNEYQKVVKGTFVRWWLKLRPKRYL